jgi:hypothetical protein
VKNIRSFSQSFMRTGAKGYGKTYTFKPGDKVRYKAIWLRNTGQATGPAGRLRGVVQSIGKLGKDQLVKVKWDDGTVMDVRGGNLQPIGKPDYSGM